MLNSIFKNPSTVVPFPGENEGENKNLSLGQEATKVIGKVLYRGGVAASIGTKAIVYAPAAAVGIAASPIGTFVGVITKDDDTYMHSVVQGVTMSGGILASPLIVFGWTVEYPISAVAGYVANKGAKMIASVDGNQEKLNNRRDNIRNFTPLKLSKKKGC